MPNQPENNSLRPLTSFRFIAALFVFGAHLYYLKGFPEYKAVYERFLSQGDIGVTFFFILSGFILTYNYLYKFDTLNKRRLKSFYISRIARIYPLHFLTFFLAIPIVYKYMLADPGSIIGKATTNLLLIQSFVPIEEIFFSMNGPSWSISDEMFFYTLFPFVIWIVRKAGIHTKGSLLSIILIWVCLLCLVFYYRDIAWSHWLFYVFPVTRFIDFVIGVLLGIFFINIKDWINHRLTSKVYYSFIELFSVLLAAIFLYFHKSMHPSLTYSVYYIPSMCLIIFIFAFQQGLLSQLLSHKMLVFLGEASFAFYMTHDLIIKYTYRMPFIKTHPIAIAITAFLVSIVACTLIHLFYEMPLRNRIRNILSYPRGVRGFNVEARNL
ncbi:acyltransferase [Paenibacillus sp. P26]|nr:acyltransferase [Paenibacillus sp. P26]